MALAAWAKGNALGKDPPPADPGGQTLSIDGVPLTFARLGSGPAVVLIHGASGNLRDMTFRLAPALARDHTVLAFDRPGHGLSGWPDRGGETLALQAAVMRRALARIGIERAILIGHSYGGSVALAWALDAPETVDGLMLLAAPSQVWSGGLGLATPLLANSVTGPVLAQALPRLVSQRFVARVADAVFAPQTTPPGYLAHLRLDLLVNPTSLRANAVQLGALKAQIRAMAPRYHDISMPVEILHGTSDTIVPIKIHSEPLSAQIPHARLTRLEGIGHMVHHAALTEVQVALDRLIGDRGAN